MESRDVELVKKWSEPLSGVFVISDLSVLFSRTTKANLYKKINQLEKENILIKVKRGIYATPEAKLEDISTRICQESYISCGNVLAKNLVIGSIPAKKIQAVKIGRSRAYECKLGRIEHLSISPKLYFGYTYTDGIKYASSEKAFLDCCYYYYKGQTFSFDLDTDINFELLNSQLIKEYLTKYDQRFITFFNKIWKI